MQTAVLINCFVIDIHIKFFFTTWERSFSTHACTYKRRCSEWSALPTENVKCVCGSWQKISHIRLYGKTLVCSIGHFLKFQNISSLHKKTRVFIINRKLKKKKKDRYPGIPNLYVKIWLLKLEAETFVRSPSSFDSWHGR